MARSNMLNILGQNHPLKDKAQEQDQRRAVRANRQKMPQHNQEVRDPKKQRRPDPAQLEAR